MYTELPPDNKRLHREDLKLKKRSKTGVGIRAARPDFFQPVSSFFGILSYLTKIRVSKKIGLISG